MPKKRYNRLHAIELSIFISHINSNVDDDDVDG
jgi:hypothetical protein